MKMKDTRMYKVIIRDNKGYRTTLHYMDYLSAQDKYEDLVELNEAGSVVQLEAENLPLPIVIATHDARPRCKVSLPSYPKLDGRNLM
jgi:hypothetical protein